MTDRLNYIDVAKGIGILLVVFGHNWIVFAEKGELFNIIYSFHMPLFLFLSGVFFNPDKKFTNLAIERADSLLKPYFVILVFLWIAYFSHKGYSSREYFVGVFYGNGTTLPWALVPMWFLTHLWIVSIFSWLFIKATNLDIKPTRVQLVFLSLLLVNGFWIVELLWNKTVQPVGIFAEVFEKAFVLPSLPFSSDIILLSSFFFLLGFAFKTKVVNFQIQKVWLIFSIVLFSSLHLIFNHTMDLNDRLYQHLLITSAEAISGIYIVLSISRLITAEKKMASMLATIGSSSLFILIFHSYFQVKTFNFLNSYSFHLIYPNAVMAFIVGSLAPLILWHIVKNNSLLALFLFPLKSNKLVLEMVQWMEHSPRQLSRRFFRKAPMDVPIVK